MHNIVFAFLLLSRSLSSGAAVPVDVVWRLPQPVPPACSEIEFELLLFDVSGSMAQLGAFDRAQAVAIRHVLNELPDCSLAIVGSFGVTADVRGGEFLVDQASRQHVAASIAALRATQGFTNLDEAAKLIELLDFQLRAAYGLPANQLVVRAYTDDQSAPSAGKSQFSLGQYLAQRMNAQHLRLALGRDGVRLLPQSALLPDPSPDRAAPARRFWVVLAKLRPFLTAGLVLLLVALIGLRWAERQRVPPQASATLEALLVAESATVQNCRPGSSGVHEHRIGVLARVPVVFSTDPDLGNYVVTPLPDSVQGELFRITPLPDGHVMVESHHPDATVNGKLIGRRKPRVALDPPLKICVGRQIFSLSGVRTTAEVPHAGEDLFQAQAMKA